MASSKSHLFNTTWGYFVLRSNVSLDPRSCRLKHRCCPACQYRSTPYNEDPLAHRNRAINDPVEIRVLHAWFRTRDSMRATSQAGPSGHEVVDD